MSTLHERIGAFIKEKRLENGASQQNLAEAVSRRLESPITGWQISMTEQGKRHLTFSEAIALSKVFGVRPEEIHEGAEPDGTRRHAPRINPLI